MGESAYGMLLTVCFSRLEGDSLIQTRGPPCARFRHRYVRFSRLEGDSLIQTRWGVHVVEYEGTFVSVALRAIL